MVSYLPSTPCPCGKNHSAAIRDVIAEKGALKRLGACVRQLGGTKPFLLADPNTFEAAGRQALDLLEAEGFRCSRYIFTQKNPEPDEAAVGSAVMHFDHSCDIVIAIGSGVINDIGKILSATAGCPYIIVATAPSMDGYASATSSMAMDGLKVTLPSRCADIILGDIDILKNAPMEMLQAGLGDMLAKYISICEWHIAHIITGEYYCEAVAELIRNALKKCADNAAGLLKRDDEAVKAVFEGLVIGGIAMAYAGVSRPASGCEHYISHIWDMRGLEFGTPVHLHGIQCALGTLICAELYHQLLSLTPDRQTALEHAAAFQVEDWNEQLRAFLGKGADAMIRQEKTEGKYDVQKHSLRLEKIMGNWDRIKDIIRKEIPTPCQLRDLLHTIGISPVPGDWGLEDDCMPMIFQTTKDIRDKYVLSRLVWDLGWMDRITAFFIKE